MRSCQSGRPARCGITEAALGKVRNWRKALFRRHSSIRSVSERCRYRLSCNQGRRRLNFGQSRTMVAKMIVRPELPTDEVAVATVIERAFGRTDESRLVERLKASGDSVVSIVAVAEHHVIGHVMLSCWQRHLRHWRWPTVSGGARPSTRRRGEPVGRRGAEAGEGARMGGRLRARRSSLLSTVPFPCGPRQRLLITLYRPSLHGAADGSGPSGEQRTDCPRPRFRGPLIDPPSESGVGADLRGARRRNLTSGTEMTGADLTHCEQPLACVMFAFGANRKWPARQTLLTWSKMTRSVRWTRENTIQNSQRSPAFRRPSK